MKFASPYMLFLIWAVPLLLLVFFYGEGRRRRIIRGFATSHGLKAVSPGSSGRRRWLRVSLYLSSLLFIAAALSGPLYGFKWREYERRGVDIIVALDCSKSMLADDVKPDRLSRAKREIYDLLDMLEGDRVGLVAFSGTAFLQCPLTLDYKAFHLFLETLEPDFLPIGGTAIAEAVGTAVSVFDPKSPTDKAVILITDGENTSGEPIEAAKAAQKAGIKLFCIGIGREEGVPIPNGEGGFKKDREGNIVLTRLDEKTLRKMALLTGGAYVRSVTGDMDLETIYKREIRGAMEARLLKSGKKRIWEDRFQWLLFPALAALCAEMLLSSASRTLLLVVFWLLAASTHPAHAGNVGNSVGQGIKAYEAGEYDKAVRSFLDAQIEAPGKPEIYYDLGTAYYKKGEYESAMQQFSVAASAKDGGLREKALFNMANTSYRLGKLDEAIRRYEQTLKLNPANEDARRNLEFVKKRLEEQKKRRQGGSQGENGEQRDKHDKEQKKKSAGKEADQPRGDGSGNETGGKTGQTAKPRQKGEDEPREQAGPAGRKKDKTPANGRTASANATSGKEKDKKGPEGTGYPGSSKGDGDRKEQQGAAAADGRWEGRGASGEREQAKRVLGRLKDQPGRAMVPMYRKREVEKDW